MSFASGYRGVVGGSVQSTVTDQPGAGVPGMLAFASDFNFADSLPVDQAAGIGAGLGVKATAVADGVNSNMPGFAVNLPGQSDDETTFFGIVVFEEAMQSDENGNPGWADGRIARVLRPGRAGGRVWVKAVEAIDHSSDTVNWVLQGGTDLLYKTGEFAPAALAGSAAAGYTHVLANARWVTSAPAGGLACLELY
jgi:hypothetical protein